MIPSLVDPSVAPPGQHVISCFVQYAPYNIKEGAEHWPHKREAFGDAVVDTLAEYVPGLKESILYRQVLTPWDLEQQFGLTEGNIFHGELSMEQLLFLRPAAGVGPIPDACGSAVDMLVGDAPRRRDHGGAGRAGRQGAFDFGAGMSRYDAIVIGAGHNGLTTAALLAKKGRQVLVLERADFVGGVAAGREFHPGFRTAGLFADTRGVRRWVADALGLELKFRSEPPSVLALGPDRSGILLHGDPAKAAAEIGKVSARDGEQYLAYRAFLDRVRPVLERFLNEAPVNLVDIESNGIWDMLTKGLRIRRLGKGDMLELLRLPPMCVADWLGEWFETDLLKAALAVPAVAGTFTGPWSPGTTANLLMLEAAAGPGIEGGGPALVAALEKAASSAGVEIRTGAEVTEIRVVDGRVAGVRVGDESIDAPVVAASCDPKRALLDLVPMGALPYRTEHRLETVRTRGTTAYVHLALKERVRFAATPDVDIEFARTGAHVDDIERAFDAIKYGERSKTPILDIHCVETTMTVAVHFAPYNLKGGWTEEAKSALADRTVELLGPHVPGITAKIVAHSVDSPADLASIYALPNGQLHHAEPALDQLLIRPIPECVAYKTPIEGLHLCGSGSHPGGGLTCAPGALAAATID